MLIKNFEDRSWKTSLLLITPFIGYILLVLPFINQLPMHEEIVHVRDTSSWKAALEYWYHPPLYVLIVKTFRSILGDAYQVTYLVGILSAFVNIYFIKAILEIIFINLDSKERLRFIMIGMWAFVLMPIAIHGSILLEMEPTVLTPLCLLAIWYYIKNENNRDAISFRVIMGILFGLTMWAKIFATPLLLIGTIFLYEWSSGAKFLKAIKYLVINLISALAFFVPTYLTYSYLFAHGRNTFYFIVTEKISADAPLFASGKLFIPIVSKLIAFTFWFSPFFIALIIYLIYGMVQKWKQFRKEQLILIAVASILLFYLIMHPYLFMEQKYFYPIFPLIAILVSSLLAVNKVRFPPLKYFFLIPINAMFIFFVFGDPLYKNFSFFRDQLINKLIAYDIFYIAVSVVFFVLFYFILKRVLMDKRNAICSSLILLSISSSLSLIASQAIGQYQTKYQYGETGAKETIAYIKHEIKSDNKIILPFDIGYYVGIKFYRESSNLSDFGNSQLDWDWIVERRVSISRLSSEKLKLLNSDYVLAKEIGSYQFFKRKR